MANEILFADTFKSYGVDTGILGPARAKFLRNWSYADNGIFPTEEHTFLGEPTLFVGSGSASFNMTLKALPEGPETEIVIGFWVFMPNAPVYASKGVFIFNNSNALMAGVVVNPDTSLTVWDRNKNDRGTSRPLLSPGVFHHVEVRFRHAIDESGQVEVRIDGNPGTPDILSAGVDMGDDPIVTFGLGQYDTGNGGVNFFMAMLFVKRDAQFLGPVLFDDQVPDGDGAEDDWAITGAATTHEALDESDYDGDATCITAENVDDRSGVTFPAMPVDTSAIKGVYVYAVARTSEPGEGKFRFDVNGEEGEEHTLLSDYRFFGQGYAVNPDGDTPWTESDVNALLVEFVKTA